MLLAKQEMPNLEAPPPDFRSNVLDPERSSFDASFDVLLNNEWLDEIEPFRGNSSTNGDDPEGGDELGENVLLLLLV